MTPSFAQLGVPESIYTALERRGITEPFEIQAATITDALDGRDVCGRAPTGSGKTLAFGIPLVASATRAEPKRPTSLVLAPTRELAEQISIEIRTFAGSVRVGVVYGGVGYGPQLKSLRQGIEILVACPGRLEDLIQRGDVHLGNVDHVVLDEADRMADMGFTPAVRRLLDQTASDRQTVLFSATLDGDVAKLTRDYQRNPARHEVGDETPDITAAHHRFWNAEQSERIEITAQAVNAVWPAIIFCRTRHGADRLAKQLGRHDIKAVAIHGGRSQGQRTRALADFSKGRVHAMVATDVAARGIHVDGVASVIHYDPPADHKDYVHRSGRTARAGEGGVVISLIQSQQRKDMRRMQRDVSLDEALTDPDAAALRSLFDAPTRTLAPAYEPRTRSESRSGDRPAGEGQKRRNGPRRSSSQKSRHQPKHGHQSSSGQKASNGQASSSQASSSQKAKPSHKKAKPSHKKKVAAEVRAGSRAKSNQKKKARHPAKFDADGRPNRKARRAHLQPGAQAKRTT